MFGWRYLDGDGNELGESHAFADRAGAEVWMGEAWADLRERGVEQVALVALDTREDVYRMALAEEAG